MTRGQAIRTWRPYVAWKKHTLRRWMGLWCWKRGGEVRGVQELLNMLWGVGEKSAPRQKIQVDDDSLLPRKKWKSIKQFFWKPRWCRHFVIIFRLKKCLTTSPLFNWYQLMLRPLISLFTSNIQSFLACVRFQWRTSFLSPFSYS